MRGRVVAAAGAALAIGAVSLTAVGGHGVRLAQASAATGSCEALAVLKLKDVRITTAETVTPNPKWPFPASMFNVFLGPNANLSGPAFCRVAGTIETEIEFELWLPRDWNGRFLGVGNGGMTGAINYPSMADGLKRGFAVASTDTGHRTVTGFFDTDWVPGHWQRVVDFGHRGHHLMAVDAKKILAAYYGAPAKRSYYQGCSSGGWQGFTEAQKYPADYDGIVAGAPAFNFVQLQTRGFWLAHLTADHAGDLSPAKQKLLVDAALARCDAQDGVRDGVMDPSQCDFDPAPIQCQGAESDTCLTAAQVERARLVYGPRKSRGGMTLYPGNAFGAPTSIVLAGADGRSLAGKPLIQLVAHAPKWTPETYDPDRDTPALEKDVGGVLSSYDPNLKAFQARGGKIVMYHGWADPLLSPYNSLDYYGRVQTALGAKTTGGFLRLFMIPGMGHCTGGPGTDSFDGLTAVMDWVEKGQAPASLLASHMTAGKADRTRPLCPYPQVAKYKGAGSTDDAANFSCGRA